jgi:hypothetical protein
MVDPFFNLMITTQSACHFEAKGREIPQSAAIKRGLLDKIELLPTQFRAEVPL